MSYPSVQINSDPNFYRLATHSSLLQPAYNMGPLGDTCRKDCNSEGVPFLYQRLGTRNACCNDNQSNPRPGVHSAQFNSNPYFPGFELTFHSTQPVDNLSGHFDGYTRDARYTGTFGGKGYGNDALFPAFCGTL